MKEGTRSYLIGCHSFIMHPLMVLKAWKWWFRSWPKFWQIVCIFIHDIGICGRQYISDNQAKDGHWMLGAWVAYKLFGMKGWYFCAGHTPESEWCSCSRSDLWFADKASWLVAPIWWLWLNYKLERFEVSHPYQWQIIIANNLLSQNHFSSHQIFIDEVKNLRK